MRPPAASVIIWHTSIFSFVSCQYSLLYHFCQEGEKGDWVVKQKTGKVSLFRYDGLVLIQWGTGTMRTRSGTYKSFCKSTIHSRLWKSGKVDCEAKCGAGRFLEFWALYRHQHKIVWVFQFLFGILGRFSFAEWLPPQLGHFGAAALPSLYLCSPLQIEQRSLPRQWFATWP